MAKPIEDDQDKLTEAEAAKRRDKVLKRMLNTPPKPHKDIRGESKKKAGKREKSPPRKTGS